MICYAVLCMLSYTRHTMLISNLLRNPPAGVEQAVVSVHAVGASGRKRLCGYVTPSSADLDAVREHCRYSTGSFSCEAVLPQLSAASPGSCLLRTCYRLPAWGQMRVRRSLILSTCYP